MKVLHPMPADQILMAEMKKSNLNVEPKVKVKPPGANPWLKYAIAGGTIIAVGCIAYYLSKPNENEK